MITQESLFRFKEFIDSKVKNVLDLLKTIQADSQSDFENASFEHIKENFNSIKQNISDGISKFEKILQKLDKELAWEDLCVGFFGETNAGKSTLIEALIGGDGRSIGDGRKDFTREVKHFEYQNIKLIDMPGIEGRERHVEREIKRAVRKAHIIFYIISSTKEPERETLNKVKSYLGSKTKIYSVINVRCGIDAFKYKKSIEGDNLSIIFERTKTSMNEIFGGCYDGMIVCHALLGFYAKGRPKQDNLKDGQRKALEYFGKNRDAILQMSRLNELETLISYGTKNVNAEIIRSNAYEAIGAISSTLGRIIKNKKELDLNIKQCENNFRQKKEEILNTIAKYKNEATTEIEIMLDNERNELVEKVYKAIDNELTEEQIKNEIKKTEKIIARELKEKLNEVVSSLNEEVGKVMEELQGRIALQGKFLSILGLEINIKEIIEKLEISALYIGKQILESLLAIRMFFFGLLGIIAGVFVFFKKILDWFFGDPEKRKKDAKMKARYEIKKAIDKIKKEITKGLNKEFNNISSNFYIQFKGFENQIRGLRKCIAEFNKYIMELKKFQREISTEMCRLLLGREDIEAYIDKINSRPYICILGATNIEEPNFKDLSIDLEHVWCFNDIEELEHRYTYKNSDGEPQDDKSEFLNRAVEVFLYNQKTTA
uniref:G domain-containing protein n=1 Tax=Caldisericum exile TaxID=693075 RepID=A0A7C4TVV0_9BACT